MISSQCCHSDQKNKHYNFPPRVTSYNCLWKPEQTACSVCYKHIMIQTFLFPAKSWQWRNYFNSAKIYICHLIKFIVRDWTNTQVGYRFIFWQTDNIVIGFVLVEDSLDELYRFRTLSISNSNQTMSVEFHFNVQTNSKQCQNHMCDIPLFIKYGHMINRRTELFT